MRSSRTNTTRERRLIIIMAVHLLAIWSLSLFSFSGTALGNAVRDFFRFASGTVTLAPGYNWWAIFGAVVLLVPGIPGVVYLVKRWYN